MLYAKIKHKRIIRSSQVKRKQSKYPRKDFALGQKESQFITEFLKEYQTLLKGDTNALSRMFIKTKLMKKIEHSTNEHEKLLLIVKHINHAPSSRSALAYKNLLKKDPSLCAVVKNKITIDPEQYMKHHGSFKVMHKAFRLARENHYVLKDNLAYIADEKISKEKLDEYHHKIEFLLDKMKLFRTDPVLAEKVMRNIDLTIIEESLKRTCTILELFAKHGLKGNEAKQFFLGGHFKIADNGALYRELATLDGAMKRISSHFPKTKLEEQGISAGRVLPEVLFIRTKDADGKEFTHFQSEASPWRQMPGDWRNNLTPTKQTLQNLEHIIDSLIYFIAKLISQLKGEPIHNRSNYGWSVHGDKNPIVSLNSEEAEGNETPRGPR